MPQMLSNYPDAKIHSYGPGILPNDFPEITAHIMRVINAQAGCDALLDQMYIYLMGTEPKLGFAALNALSSAEARRAAFLGVARASLSGDHYRLIEAVFKLTKSTRKRRNEFAHGLWGRWTKKDRAVVLILPEAITLALIADRELSLGGPQGKAAGAHEIDGDLCFVYDEKEAATASHEALMSLMLIDQLTHGFYMRAEVGDETTLDRLRKRPEVARALQS